MDCSYLFIYIFSPNCTKYTILTSFLFFEPEILWTRNYEMYHCARNNYLFVTSTPSKNNTQTRSLYSFFVPPKSKFLPLESYSPKKNGVLSYFIANIDLELFTTSPKPPIFNLSNNKSIINFLTPPHFSSKLEVTFIDCPMEYHLWWDKKNPQILTITPYPLSQNLPPFKKNPCSSYFFLSLPPSKTSSTFL